MYKIVYMSDSTDCETCGPSWAEGYEIYKDDVLVVEKAPLAHCYDSVNHPHENALKEILDMEKIIVYEEYRDLSTNCDEDEWDDLFTETDPPLEKD